VQGSFVYVADLTGSVYGTTDSLTRAWSRDYLTEDDRPVQADLTADASGVYVSGTDGLLYALTREGRVRWKFFAAQALFSRPIVTEEWVYQAVGSRGDERVVAIDKFARGISAVEATWEAPGAIGFLSQDDENVYLLHNDGRVAAHDKQTGEEKFRSKRSGFVRFARNEDGSMFYAATSDGEVVAVEPVTRRGVTGEEF
jgi:outer membrane protein assembly factor BamB